MSSAHRQTIDELVRHPPYFHEGGQWTLPPDALKWITTHVKPGWRTVETGCGASTALFTALGAHHIAIAPHRDEHDAVHAWCRERGVAVDRLVSVVALSQDVLPTLQAEPFDVALIDGAHSFPIPMIDWYYLATRLKTGGFLLIDDLPLRAPRLLHDFLFTEGDRWRFEAALSGTAVFRKIGATLIPDDDWPGQPWSRPSLVTRIRARGRIRTRLRDLRRPPRR